MLGKKIKIREESESIKYAEMHARISTLSVGFQRLYLFGIFKIFLVNVRKKCQNNDFPVIIVFNFFLMMSS